MHIYQKYFLVVLWKILFSQATECIWENAMTKKETRPDLEKIISLGRNGIIDPDYLERWGQFKEDWTEADLATWNKLKEKMTVSNSGELEFCPPPSSSEKVWAKKFIPWAEERGLC